MTRIDFANERNLGHGMTELRMGDLVCNLIARVNRFTQPMQFARQTMTQLKSSVGSGVSAIQGSFEKLTGIGGVISGVFAGLTVGAALTAFSSIGGELTDMSARTGASVESLSLLSFAAKQTGTDIGTVESALKPLDNLLSDAAGGNAKAAETLSRFGLNANTLMKLPLEARLGAIGNVLNGIEHPSQRGAAAVDLLGKAGRDLIPMLAELGPLTQRAKDLGLVFSKQDAALGDAVGDRLDEIHAVFGRLLQMAGGALAPVFLQMTDSITTWIPTVQAIVAWFGNLVALVTPIVSYLWEGFAVIAATLASWIAITGVVALLMNPITWIVAGIVALGAAIGWVLNQFGGLLAVIELIKFSFTNFGDLATLLGLKILLPFVSTFNAITFFFTDTLPAVFAAAASNAGTFFGDLANYVGAMFRDLAENLSGIFLDLWDIAGGGRGSHQWKKLGSDFRSRELKPMELPVRVASGFEKGILDSIAAVNAKLADSWAKRNVGPMAEKIHGLDPSDPKYVPGGADIIKKSQEEEAASMKPLKLSGALQVGSKEAYSAIVQAMAASRSRPQDNDAKKTAKAAERTADNTFKLKQLAEKNKVGVVATLDGPLFFED